MLAELGIVNQGDQLKDLVHFQEPHIKLEPIHDNNLIYSLEKQLPFNNVVKQLPTWNVPMRRSLNAIPPCQHLNGLPKEVYEEKKIPQASQVDEILSIGNFVLTGNNQHSSVNIFSTQLGLNRVMQHNLTSAQHKTPSEGVVKPMSF